MSPAIQPLSIEVKYTATRSPEPWAVSSFQPVWAETEMENIKNKNSMRAYDFDNLTVKLLRKINNDF